MANSQYIVDVTAANFEQQVAQTSHQVPVVLDFWASWCQPCQMLMPILTGLAEQYAGQFVLAKVNIDEQQELAMQFGVRSVPTVKVFRFGAVVDEFLGVQPEAQIREIIDRYIERASDRVLAAALQQFAAGDTNAAIAAVRQVLADEPANERAQVILAELLMGVGSFTEARALIEALPADARMADEVQALATRLEFAEAAEQAPAATELERRLADNPADSEARYQLGVQRLGAGEYEGALEAFLELMRRDRRYGDDAGRKGMLKAFELIEDPELIARYRRKMAQALY